MGKPDSAPVMHASEIGSLEYGDDNFVHPACTCGWKSSSPMPDVEIAVDELMAHAFVAGRDAGPIPPSDDPHYVPCPDCPHWAHWHTVSGCGCGCPRSEAEILAGPAENDSATTEPA